MRSVSALAVLLAVGVTVTADSAGAWQVANVQVPLIQGQEEWTMTPLAGRLSGMALEVEASRIANAALVPLGIERGADEALPAGPTPRAAGRVVLSGRSLGDALDAIAVAHGRASWFVRWGPPEQIGGSILGFWLGSGQSIVIRAGAC